MCKITQARYLKLITIFFLLTDTQRVNKKHIKNGIKKSC